MAKMKWKGGALIAPLPPVMVSCGDMEKSNIMTVAWTGIINTIPPKTYISVRPSRYSYNIIKESGEFIINLTPAKIIKAADYCGIYTGAKVDKFAKCNLTKEKANLESEIKRVEGKLSNQGFVAKAPAKLIEEEYISDGNDTISVINGSVADFMANMAISMIATFTGNIIAAVSFWRKAA